MLSKVRQEESLEEISESFASRSDWFAPFLKLKAAFVFGVVFVLSIYPPLLSLNIEGKAAIFKYFADDTFYYLIVASRSTTTPFYTFDGKFATNGFHPLWQYYLTAAFNVLHLSNDQTGQLVFTFFSSVLLTSLGAALFSLALLKLTNNPLLAVLGIVPGPYYFFLGDVDRHYSSIWSFMNGMESPLSLFLFGILSILLINRKLLDRMTRPVIVLISVVLTVIALTRLDDIFIFGPFLLLVAFSSRERVKNLLYACAVPTLSFVAYFAYNLVTVGNAVPISGLLKMGGSSLENFNYFAESFVPGLQYLKDRDSVWENTVFRALQMCIPAALAFVTLSYFWLSQKNLVIRTTEGEEEVARTGQSFDRVIWFFSLYVLIKGLYNFFCIPLWNQGHWYYALSIQIFNLLVVYFVYKLLKGGIAGRLIAGARVQYSALVQYLGICGGLLLVIFALGNLAQQLSYFDLATTLIWVFWLGFGAGLGWLALIFPQKWNRSNQKSFGLRVLLSLILGVAAILVIIINANAFVDLKRTSSYNKKLFTAWTERDRYAQELKGVVNGTYIEMGDGILSFVLAPIPSMSGTFAIDHEGFEARKRGELLRLAYQRGIRWFGSQNFYTLPEAAYQDSAVLKASLKEHSTFMQFQSLDDWDFKVAYKDVKSNLVMIEFFPKTGK